MLAQTICTAIVSFLFSALLARLDVCSSYSWPCQTLHGVNLRIANTFNGALTVSSRVVAAVFMVCSLNFSWLSANDMIINPIARSVCQSLRREVLNCLEQ